MSNMTEIFLHEVLQKPISGSRPKGGVNIKGDIPSFGGENITMSGTISFYPVRKITTEFFNIMKRGHLKDLDIVINKDGANTGKSAIYHNSPYLKAAINEHLFILRGVPEKIDQVYLHYSLLFPKTKNAIKAKINGSAQPGLNSNFIQNLPIKIFPLPEQKKIASILTSVDEVIENTKKQIDKLHDLKKATMNKLLTKGIGHTEFKSSELGRIPKSWQVVATTDLFDFKNGLNKEKDAFGRGQKIVNYMDVFTHPEIKDYDLFGRVELSKSEADRFSVMKNDVFFTRTSETPEEIGLSSVITEVSEKVCFSGFVLRGRPVASMLFPPLSGYLYRCNYVRQQIVSTCSYTTRALTNGTSLGKVLVAVPSYSEQKFIHASITAISENIIQLDKKLNKIQSLKKSLMQDLLTGKVRVKVN